MTHIRNIFELRILSVNILNIVLEIRNIQCRSLSASPEIVTGAPEEQQVFGILPVGPLINHPHVVANGDGVLGAARELVVNLLRGDHLHIQPITLGTELRQPVSLRKEVGMHHDHHIDIACGVQILVGYGRQRLY